MSKALLMNSVAAAALVVLSGAAFAGPTLYTSAASFAAATTAPGVDTYTGFSITSSTPSPITRNAGAYTYTATAETTTFFGAGTTANPWLSTNTATDSITFSNFIGGVTAIGGNFFGSDISGLFAAGDITLTATDSTGSTTFTITGATVNSFAGFVSSTTGFTSLVVRSVQPASGFLWPTVDNLTLAKTLVTAVPEPETYALMLAGLGVLGFVARRRRA
jgi:PEP-CTERM motif